MLAAVFEVWMMFFEALMMPCARLPGSLTTHWAEALPAKIWLSLGEHSTLQNEAGIKTSWWGTLLKKNTFKWMVTKYNSEKDG